MPLSPKENLLRALHHAGPDHVPYAGEGSYRIVDHRGRKPPRDGVDTWGVTWGPLPPEYRTGSDEPLESFPVSHPAASAAELAALSFPSGDDSTLFDGLTNGIDRDATLVIGRHGAGPLDRLCALLGMPEALAGLLMEPEAAQAALERIADYHLNIAHNYLAAGAEAGFLADDYAGQEGPYLRPAVWRRMILPGLARLIAVYRQAGAPVFFHTCGRAEAFIGDLIEAGVTAFNLQSDVCDLASLKAIYGRRIGFFGGVSSATMLTGTPEDVEQAARMTMRALGDEGGLVLAPDQPLRYRSENAAALMRAACQFGHYPLQ